MTLGASTSDILEFLIVLAVAVMLGFLAIPLHFLRLTTQNKALLFIYDLSYAIIVDGIFLALMFRINTCDIEYYHILALVMGILLAGILPLRYIRLHDEKVKAHLVKAGERIKKTRLYRIIKK